VIAIGTARQRSGRSPVGRGARSESPAALVNPFMGTGVGGSAVGNVNTSPAAAAPTRDRDDVPDARGQLASPLQSRHGLPRARSGTTIDHHPYADPVPCGVTR
jgi:hypothetical protein